MDMAEKELAEKEQCDGILNGFGKKDSRVAEDSPRSCCAQRWILAVMGLWLGIMNYMLSSNMSIAVVCMVKDRPDPFEYMNNISNMSTISYYAVNQSVTNTSDVYSNGTVVMSDADTGGKTLEIDRDSCEVLGKARVSKSKGAEFSWSKETQSFVLSSYFYGYMIMQIPSGWLAAKFGGKLVIGSTMVVASVMTLLVPVFARTDVYILIVARALLGICMGMVLPAHCGLVGTWALPTERSRFMALCWFGHMAGAVLGYSSSGFLCVHGFSNGWDSIFYVHGLVGVLFVVTWWYVVYSSPQQHPRISEAEKSLILKHVHIQSTQSKKTEKVPWKHLFRHIPVYVVFLSHICDNWTFYLLLTCLPQFMQQVLKFDVQSNGIFSCLPFVTLMFGIGFAGICADFIQSKKCISVTATRKIFQISGLIGVAVFILIPGYLSCEHRAGAVVCLCLCTLFEGVGLTGGYSTNAIDIAPRFASVIFAISNTVATIPGMVAPMLVAAVTKNETNEEWRVIFYIAGGFSLFTAVVYGIFASSELATWANANTDIEIKYTSPCSDKLMVQENGENV